MIEIRLSRNTIRPEDVHVSYNTDDELVVSFPGVYLVGTAEEASELFRTILRKFGEADVHALLLKGVLKK